MYVLSLLLYLFVLFMCILSRNGRSRLVSEYMYEIEIENSWNEVETKCGR